MTPAAGLSFVGVPIDSVQRTGDGAEHSPAALRELGLPKVLGGSDLGDLDVRIRGDERDPQTGLLGSADVLATTTTVRSAVADAVGRGERPFMAGGAAPSFRELSPGRATRSAAWASPTSTGISTCMTDSRRRPAKPPTCRSPW